MDAFGGFFLPEAFSSPDSLRLHFFVVCLFSSYLTHYYFSGTVVPFDEVGPSPQSLNY